MTVSADMDAIAKRLYMHIRTCLICRSVPSGERARCGQRQILAADVNEANRIRRGYLLKYEIKEAPDVVR